MPVFAGVLRTHFGADGSLAAISGTLIPEINVDPTPSVGQQAAGGAALAVVSDLVARNLAVRSIRLLVFRTGLMKGVEGRNHLAREVEVGSGEDVRELVYVSAHTAKVLDRINAIQDALNRRAYHTEANWFRLNPPGGDRFPPRLVCRHGGGKGQWASAMPLFWTVVFVSMPALGFQPQTAESDLLADSELIYRVSGGFAGVVRTARLVAKTGKVTAEYAASDASEERFVGPQVGPREPAPYLELWAEAERAGIWTLQVPGKQKGADLMHHELVARVGERRHSISWTDGDASTPSARDALRIAERILALSREVAAER